jgi:hypothetical protein
MSVFRDMTGPLLDEAERRLAELRGERQQAERRYELACVSLEKRVAEPLCPRTRLRCRRCKGCCLHAGSWVGLPFSRQPL